MATYTTKEQIDLVNEIRKLSEANQNGLLDYEGSIYLLELKEDADQQNLCWW